MHSLPTVKPKPRAALPKHGSHWFVALLLLAMSGLLFHPLIHHHADEQCVICVLGANASPLPASHAMLAPAPLARIEFTVSDVPAPVSNPPRWREPPGRAPPPPTS